MASGKEIRRILVRAPNWIGDSVMCLPALASLKRLFPSSGITVLTRGRSIGVFENNPDVKEIIEYEDKSRHKGLRGRLTLAGELKARGFDLAVLFQNAFDAAFLAYIARIPERVGYSRDFRSGLLTGPIRVTGEIKNKHLAYYYLNIVQELGGSLPISPVPRIYISGDEEAWADEFIRKNGLTGAVLFGAAPGASYGPAKRWGAERFALALKTLSDAFKGKAVPVIFGGPEDAEICGEVSRLMRSKHLDLAGSVTLRQFMALLSRLKVFITNDSGPMHISAALGVPTLAIFGSTDPTLTGPLGKTTKVMIKKIDCSPCFDRTCRYGHYKCLGSIEPHEVFLAAQSLMNSTGAENA